MTYWSVPPKTATVIIVQHAKPTDTKLAHVEGSSTAVPWIPTISINQWRHLKSLRLQLRCSLMFGMEALVLSLATLQLRTLVHRIAFMRKLYPKPFARETYLLTWRHDRGSPSNRVSPNEYCVCGKDYVTTYYLESDACPFNPTSQGSLVMFTTILLKDVAATTTPTAIATA
jgi:hypothetical protein